MSNVNVPTATVAEAPSQHVIRQLCLGFGYWLAFVLVLEPGNLLGASDVAWSQEIMRMAGAGALGALATPLLFALVQRYPVEGPQWQRRLGIQMLGAVVAAAVLIILSCLLADWFLTSEHRPLARALLQELFANWMLLCFAVAGILVGAHAIRFAQHATTSHRPNTGTYLTRVSVKMRGRVHFVDFADVSWIEAQGNYVALHTESGEHLVRQSLSSLERQLNPNGFVRIHRSVIVATKCIESLLSLGAGDAKLLLTNGTELRLSRAYRNRLDPHLTSSAPT